MNSRVRVAALLCISIAFVSANAKAQGCMPIRFVSPAVGGRGDAYLDEGAWQLSFAYRHLHADEFFIGTRQQPDSAPRGEPIIINSNTVDLSVKYALTDRVTIALNVPWTRGMISTVHADLARHENAASGFGDINVRASVWLWDRNTNPRGNIAVGLGVRAPTGKTNAPGTVWRANGTTIDFPVAVAVQPGEGGWGIIFQGEAFRHLARRTFVYAGGVYNANPKESINVLRDPGGTLLIGVPDTYSIRSGASINLLSKAELSPEARTFLSASIGWRHDATTRRDLFGGKDLAFRAPASVGYLDNGGAIVKGRYAFSVNVPVRVYQNYRKSYADVELNRHGGGDLARYLILAELSRTY